MRSVTKTPFEISLNINDPESRYAAVVFDAEGNPLHREALWKLRENMPLENGISLLYMCMYAMLWNILSGGAIR